MVSKLPAPSLGSLGLTQIHGATGQFIRVGQWLNGDGFANYEHAVIYIGGGWLVEAEPGGARKRLITEYDNILWSTGGQILTLSQSVDIANVAIGYIGVPYSFLDYTAIAAHRLDLPVPGLYNYIKTTKHMICSQLVDQCYHDAGVHLFTDDRWPGFVTPEDLYNLDPVGYHADSSGTH